jgi:predicted DNA-binding transcriptional regulator YafY
MPKGGSPQPCAAENHAEIIAILKARPEGVALREIAKMVGASTRTVYQRMNYLSLSAPIYQDAGRWRLLDRKALL